MRFFPIIRNVHASNVDRSNAAHSSQKNILIRFGTRLTILVCRYLSLLSFENWQNVVSAINLVYF